MTLPPLLEPLLVIAGVAAGAIGALWALSGRLIRSRPWSDRVRRTGLSLLRTPGTAIIAGSALLAVDGQLWAGFPGQIPPSLGPPSVAFLVELVVLWSFISVAAAAVGRHVIDEGHETGRFLVYGVYAAGLLAFVLILLSSPEVPHVAAAAWTVASFLVGLVATYLAVHIVNLLADRYFRALAGRRPGLQTIYVFIRRAVLVGVVLVGVAVTTYATFPAAAVAVTSLILAAGFLSIVLGLAAQSTLANVIAGAMVSLAQPFEIGDAVVFPYPNGDWCFVEDVRLTYTVLRTWDLRRLMVPNSLFQSTVLVNYTAVDATMLVIVALQISYESNVDRAREIMLEEARRHPDTIRLGNLPVTHVMEYGDSGVQLRLLTAARDQPTAFQVEKDLLYTIRKRFTAEGIHIPYPTRRLLMDGPARGTVARGAAPVRAYRSAEPGADPG